MNVIVERCERWAAHRATDLSLAADLLAAAGAIRALSVRVERAEQDAAIHSESATEMLARFKQAVTGIAAVLDCYPDTPSIEASIRSLQARVDAAEEMKDG
jgi:hypothetical protein